MVLTIFLVVSWQFYYLYFRVSANCTDFVHITLIGFFMVFSPLDQGNIFVWYFHHLIRGNIGMAYLTIFFTQVFTLFDG
jgi:hypothetical protein